MGKATEGEYWKPIADKMRVVVSADDLLSALIELTREAKFTLDYADSRSATLCHAVRKAEAAIAKAKGTP